MNINSTSCFINNAFTADPSIPPAPLSAAKALVDLRAKMRCVREDLMSFEGLTKQCGGKSLSSEIPVVSMPSTTFLRYYVVPHSSSQYPKCIRVHELQLAMQGAQEKLQVLEQEKKTLVQQQESYAFTMFMDRIAVAQKEGDLYRKSQKLREMANHMLNAGYAPSAAIKVASLIPLENIQGGVLQELSQRLFDPEDVNDALLCVEGIHNCPIQTDALDRVSQRLGQLLTSRV